MCCLLAKEVSAKYAIIKRIMISPPSKIKPTFFLRRQSPMDRNLLLARSPASSQFATQPSFEVTMEKYFHSNWANSPYYSGIPLLPETKVVWVLWTGSSKTIISRSFKRNSIQCPKNTSVSIERLSELYFCSGWWERRMQALELGRRQNQGLVWLTNKKLNSWLVRRSNIWYPWTPCF